LDRYTQFIRIASKGPAFKKTRPWAGFRRFVSGERRSGYEYKKRMKLFVTETGNF
jgi:hypothetical protein